MVSSKDPKFNIIINADDYGLSPAFNRGILDLAKKGIVTSISIMIKRKHISPPKLKSIKNISLGLHLELKKKDTQKEIERQITLFENRFGFFPSHLDGHQHMHITPTNLPKTMKMAKKYSLPVRSRFPEDRDMIRRAGLDTPDDFISWHPKRKATLFKRLASVRRGTVEMVCHPGHYDKKSKVPYNLQREMELNILSSREFQKTLRQLHLANYYEI